MKAKNNFQFSVFLKRTNAGFTLMELVVTIAVLVTLLAIGYASMLSVRNNLKVTEAGLVKKEMTLATRTYFADMGFYPPDVNRGWDPGFERMMPWNADREAGETTPDDGTDCTHCPSGWETILAEKWKGPYMQWPRRTPWGGRYDYNYWPTDEPRNGCIVPAGVYAGAQGDYSNNNTVPEDAEGLAVTKGYDADNCINGESQLELKRLII